MSVYGQNALNTNNARHAEAGIYTSERVSGMAFSGLFQKAICPKCGQAFSATKAECPHCGERVGQPSTRVLKSSDAVRRSTAAGIRAEADTRWQLIFGLCLVAAVIVAVIVLVTTTLKGEHQIAEAPSPSESIMPSETPSPTPSPTPTPTVDSLAVTFLGQVKTEFSMQLGGTIQLDASIYPVEIEGPVEWSVSSTGDDPVITVDDNGLVTAVGSGWASVIIRLYGKAAECKVLVH